MRRAALTLELPERRVCKAVGQPRSTHRYKQKKADADRAVVAAMTELDRKNRRFG